VTGEAINDNSGVIETSSARERRNAWLALLLLVPVPTIGVAMWMVVPGVEGTTLGKIAYVAGKAWILLLPIVWLRFVDRKPLSLSPARHGGFGVGIGLGVLIGALIIVSYFLFARKLIDPAAVRTKVFENGLDTPLKYFALCSALSVVNSLLEEYVWRWFVFRKCEVLVGGASAVVLSAAFFTYHHIIAIGAQFNWQINVLANIGIFIGGAAWSWCYLKYRSVWPGYVSHLIVDVAVFYLGWRIAFGGG
jgi:membrane protease YdiL (CAAX protease family)